MNFSLYYPPFHVDKDKTNTSGPRWMEWINGFDLMLNNCSVPEVSADLGAIMLNAVMRRCLSSQLAYPFIYVTYIGGEIFAFDAVRRPRCPGGLHLVECRGESKKRYMYTADRQKTMYTADRQKAMLTLGVRMCSDQCHTL